MEQFYTDERNVQILIALLKEHGIKKIVASPGSTNVTFVGSIQQDPFLKSILVWMNVRLRILLVGWQRKVENQ